MVQALSDVKLLEVSFDQCWYVRIEVDKERSGHVALPPDAFLKMLAHPFGQFLFLAWLRDGARQLREGPVARV